MFTYCKKNLYVTPDAYVLETLLIYEAINESMNQVFLERLTRRQKAPNGSVSQLDITGMLAWSFRNFQF